MQIESGERGECRRWRVKRPEQVAAVGVQHSRFVAKAHTGHRNRTPALYCQSSQQGASNIDIFIP